MNRNNSYHQNKREQLNAYKVELSKLKTLSLKTNETTQGEMVQNLRWIGFMIDEINSILIDYQKTTGKSWLSNQIGLESALATLQDSMNAANTALKNELVSSRWG